MDQNFTKERLACLELSLLTSRAGQAARWCMLCGSAVSVLEQVQKSDKSLPLKEKERQAILSLGEGWRRGRLSQRAEQILRACQKQNIAWITYEEKGYPYLLKHISDPPLILYYRGRAELFSMPCVSVVGSRRASSYGQKVAYELGEAAAREGLMVVSGLARGIDSCAHKGALDAGGKTLAVMPCGLDLCYPKNHMWLYHRICEEGMAVSEYPPGVKAEKWHFIDRNRMISGLSAATVVAQAGPKSGSIRTAQLAAEQGREVFGVPGDIYDPEYLGVHHLIQDGANVVTNPKWLIRLLIKNNPIKMQSEKKLGHAVSYRTKRKSEELADEQTIAKELAESKKQSSKRAGEAVWLYDSIEEFGCLSERLCELTGKSAAEVQQAITILELRGLVKRDVQQRITKV